GTVWRWFEARRRFADPLSVVEDPSARVRSDVGDFRLGTSVTVAEARGASVLLRFGTRLPTTDDAVGLERDRTDFFATIGGRLARGAFAATLETGLGIQGTVESQYDQVDVWLYSAAAEYQWGALTTGIALVGHTDGLRGPGVRGNENLSELQADLRIGRRRWARLTIDRGLAPYSPRLGATVSLGLAIGIGCEAGQRPPVPVHWRPADESGCEQEHDGEEHRLHQAGAGHRGPHQDRGRRCIDRWRRHQVRDQPVRRVRDRGRVAAQGERRGRRRDGGHGRGFCRGRAAPVRAGDGRGQRGTAEGRAHAGWAGYRARSGRRDQGARREPHPVRDEGGRRGPAAGGADGGRAARAPVCDGGQRVRGAGR